MFYKYHIPWCESISHELLLSTDGAPCSNNYLQMKKLRLKQAWLAQDTQGLQGLVSGFESASLQSLSLSLTLTQLIHEL